MKEESSHLNTHANRERDVEEKHAAESGSHQASGSPMEEEEEEEEDTTVIESQRLLEDSEILADNSELKLQQVAEIEQQPEDSDLSVEETRRSARPGQNAAVSTEEDAGSLEREAHGEEMNVSSPKAFQPPANPPPPPESLHSSSGQDTR